MKISLGLLFLAVTLVSTSIAVGQDDPSVPPGQIAFVGGDRNIYRIDMQSNTIIALTQDASETRSYGLPIWSRDNRLAYILQDVSSGTKTTTVLVSRDDMTTTVAYTTQSDGFTYAYWSPENCTVSKDCRDLAILTNNPIDRLFSVRLIRDSNAGQSVTLAGRGSPFYFSWSPDGSRMIWQRDNQRLDIYDVNTAITQPLPFIVGLFQSPAWSPIDDRWLIATAGEDVSKTTIAIASDASTRPLAQDVTGPVALNWSPDGNHIAYTDGAGNMVVLNSVTGAVEARSPVSGIYAFFWSPNSQLIAYVTLGTLPGAVTADSDPRWAVLAPTEPTIAWSVLDIQHGANRRFGSFSPTPEMIYMLRFFDQFAQSHRVWSPDSHYLVYSEIGTSGPSISILDIMHEATVPLSIAVGYFGVWSFN